MEVAEGSRQTDKQAETRDKQADARQTQNAKRAVNNLDEVYTLYAS